MEYHSVPSLDRVDLFFKAGKTGQDGGSPSSALQMSATDAEGTYIGTPGGQTQSCEF